MIAVTSKRATTKWYATKICFAAELDVSFDITTLFLYNVNITVLNIRPKRQYAFGICPNQRQIRVWHLAGFASSTRPTTHCINLAETGKHSKVYYSTS